MRLLNTWTFEVEYIPESRIQLEPYAILSHRWLGDDEEIKFQDIHKYSYALQSGERPFVLPQLDKIRGACDVARGKALRWLWMDTCCIDKTDTREYAEAINSMFRWYRDAKLCITYLSDVQNKYRRSSLGRDIFRGSPGQRDRVSTWFSRGWTLQELLAPSELEFYDMDWNFIGTKRELASAIAEVTSISPPILTGQIPLSNASIAQKMSWMSGRQTTHPEDMAYSMIGIFNITMPFIYGESGARAFRRLQEILLASPSMDESLFAWRMPSKALHSGKDKATLADSDWEQVEWGLLADSPDWFAGSGDIEIPGGRAAQVRTFRMLPQGLEAPIRKKVYLGPDGSSSSGTRRRQGGKSSISPWISLAGTVIKSVNYLTVGMRVNQTAMEDYDFTLNCFRWSPSGQPLNVVIQLRPVYVDELTVGGGTSSVRNQTKGAYVYPYTECKRMRCHELGLTEEPITNYGNGIVFQPQSNC
ncbi:HET-domain-containing protein [Xylariaceae sp. FL0255]|nr:HET-domain-containing protein [Xylariaceae sp. FL0255]